MLVDTNVLVDVLENDPDWADLVHCTVVGPVQGAPACHQPHHLFRAVADVF
ncbi:MAG: hypothetical protein RIQ49_2570 [Pseudomonadota bacterium]